MLLAIALIIFAVIAHQKPTFAVGLILALLPAYQIRYQYHSIPTTLLELLLLVFILIVFAANWRRLGEIKTLSRLNWWIGLFLLAGLISVLTSPEHMKAVGLFKAFVLEPVLFFYSLRLVIKKPTDLISPLNLLFISACLISILGIVQYFTLWHLPLQFWGTGAEVERITSVFDYPNALALYLAPLSTFFFAMLLAREKAVNGKNLAVGLVIIGAALLLTFSRGAWIAVAFTSLALLLIRYPWRRVLAGTVLAAALILIIPQTRSRLSLISHDPSSAAHSELMVAAIKKIKTSPLLGNGLYGFRTTLTQQNFSGEILNYPHNIFLNFWVEMGLLGLTSFFAIILVATNKYKISPNWYKLASCAFLITMTIHGLVDVPYFKNDLSVLFWFVISIFYI